MTRRPRFDAPGTLHHVMNRGVDHQRIFFGDRDRLDFGALLAEIHQRHDIVVLGYCLLDNHYHLLVECPVGRLSDAMHHLGSVFAHRVNARNGRDGHLFRGRFHSERIDTDAYFLTALRYVHRNALDVRSVSDVGEYRWSSHRAYLGLRPEADWLDTSLGLSYFHSRADFDRFVRRDVDGWAPFVDADVLDAAIASMVELHRSDGLPHQHLDRTVMELLAERLPSAERTRLETILGPRSRNAAASARSRARTRLAAHPEIGTIVDSVVQLLRTHAISTSTLARRERVG